MSIANFLSALEAIPADAATVLIFWIALITILALRPWRNILGRRM